LICFPLFFLLLCPAAIAGFGGEYAQGLIARAEEMRLWEDPYWLTLGHYRPTPLGMVSRVDDPDFFLHENGKTDPKAELLLTVEALFDPPTPEAPRLHTVCRFPARTRWLVEKLAIDTGKLPVPVCEPYEERIKRLAPESVSLSFPAAYINSPASMFGHTLLIIRSQNTSDLVAQAVNYAAVTNETFGPSYAFKGVFGLYQGYFSMQPYYEKIQEYSHVSRRDIWEYSLNLTEVEIRRLLDHLWELDKIYSDYFFFDENCSHALLYLLDAARPGLSLEKQTGPWVIPTDTIRLAMENGLVEERTFRPSKETTMRRMAAALPEKARALARAVARGDKEPEALAQSGLDEQTRALALDYAAETLQYFLISRQVEKQDYKGRYIRILTARSKLGPAPNPVEEAEPPAPPEDGHLSALFAAGAMARDGDSYVLVRLRPAYHGLVDDPDGYATGAQIFFGDLVLRMSAETMNWEVHRLDAVNIVSVAPVDGLFSPMSWMARVALEQRLDSGGGDSLAGVLELGGGKALRLGPATVYGFVLAEAAASEGLERSHALGPALRAGLLLQPHDRLSVHACAQYTHFAVGDKHDRAVIGLDAQVHLSQRHAVQGSVRAVDSHGYSATEAGLAVNIYF